MGIKQRQEREREAVQRAILDAARDLFVAEGYGNVSIRKIAERIEYSPAAIYGYFPSKDDIFFALAEEGFRLLSEMATPDDRTTGEPVERVRETFWRFYQFSRRYPEHFELMFVDRSVPRITREYERFSFVGEMKRRLMREIERCIEAKIFPSTLNPAVAFRMLSMGVLGAAVMRLSGRFSPGEDADLIAADVLDVTLAGLRSGVALRSKGIPCGDDEFQTEAARSARSAVHDEEKE
jgi:AcrR family transcriptional regulator